MIRYIVSPQAERDLDAIKLFLVREADVRITRHVIRGLREGMETIGKSPGIGHSRQDLTDLPLKFWKVFSYLVVYDAAASPIQIVRILHGARDISTVLSR